MKFLNFLKKLKNIGKAEKRPEPEQEKEKVKLSEIENWLKSKEDEIIRKEKELFPIIRERTDVFEKEVEEKLNALESVDLEPKKADERLKSQSYEGRKKYAGFVRELIEKLKSLEEDRLQATESKFNSLFSNFSKKAGKSYERATILIGEEARKVKEETQKYFNEITTIFKNNKNLTEKAKIISSLKKKADWLKNTNNTKEKFNKELKETEEMIDKKARENKEIFDETGKIEESPDYAKYKEKQEKLRSLKNEKGKEISSLRQNIDFKTLGNFYHSFPDKMEIVKSYRDNFTNYFEEDNGKRIIDLIEKANLPAKKIHEKLNLIKKKNDEISGLENEIKEDKSRKRLSDLTAKMTNVTMELGGLRSKKSIHEQKLEKLKINKGKIIEKIKENVNNLGVEIVDE